MDMILKIIMVIINIIMITLILVQKDREGGLGMLAGQKPESYWTRNAGRSTKGRLIFATRCLTALFFILAIAIYAVS